MVVRANEYILCGGRALNRGDIIPEQWADLVEPVYIMSPEDAAREFGDDLPGDDDHGAATPTEEETSEPDPNETGEDLPEISLDGYAEPEPSAGQDEDPEDLDPYPVDGTVTAVLQWVDRAPDGFDGDRREYALDEEAHRQGGRRRGVLKGLGAE